MTDFLHLSKNLSEISKPCIWGGFIFRYNRVLKQTRSWFINEFLKCEFKLFLFSYSIKISISVRLVNIFDSLSFSFKCSECISFCLSSFFKVRNNVFFSIDFILNNLWINSEFSIIIDLSLQQKWMKRIDHCANVSDWLVWFISRSC